MHGDKASRPGSIQLEKLEPDMPKKQNSKTLTTVLAAFLVALASGAQAQALDATVQAEKPYPHAFSPCPEDNRQRPVFTTGPPRSDIMTSDPKPDTRLTEQSDLGNTR